jgi:hypothetical protein
VRFLITTQHPKQHEAALSVVQSPLATDSILHKVRITWLAPALLLLATALFALTTLLNFPAAFIDESWNANRAWTFLHTGRVFASVDSGVYQQYDGYWTYFPYLATVVHAPFLWMFGPGLLSVRVASVAFGLVLMLNVYIIGNALYGRQSAFIATALLATSGPFVYSSHLGRHDIIVAALGFGAVALYVLDRGSSFSAKSVLSGLALGLALDIHFNILIFGPVLLTFYILDYGKNVLRTGRFWGFVLGGLIGVLFFVAMHLVSYPQTYFAIASLGNGTAHTPPILLVDLNLWRASLMQALSMIDLVLIPILVPAFILLVRRQYDHDRKIYALLGILLLAVASVIQYNHPHYAILVAPAVSLMLAPYLQHITQTIGKIGEWAFWRNILILGIVLSASVSSLAPAVRGSDAEFRKVLDYIRQTVPNGSLVYGSPTYWFALPDTPYVIWEQIVFLQRYRSGSSFTDAIEEIKPDYLIIDGFMDVFVMDDKYCRANYLNIPCMPQVELQTFLEKHATLAGELETTDYGHIRVYKIAWPSKGAPGKEKEEADR